MVLNKCHSGTPSDISSLMLDGFLALSFDFKAAWKVLPIPSPLTNHSQQLQGVGGALMTALGAQNTSDIFLCVPDV